MHTVKYWDSKLYHLQKLADSINYHIAYNFVLYTSEILIGLFDVANMDTIIQIMAIIVFMIFFLLPNFTN